MPPLDDAERTVPAAAPPLISIREAASYKPLPFPGKLRRLFSWVGQKIETANISLRVRPSTPACGEMVRVRYTLRNGHRAALRIDDVPARTVAGRGTIATRVKAQAIDVSVTDQNSEICGTRIEPWFIIPCLSRLRWAAPPVAGDHNILIWKVCRADSAFLVIQQGDLILHQGPASRRGRTTVTLPSTNDVHVTLTAKSRHYEWNSRAEKNFTLDAPVQAPAVAFDHVEVPEEIVHGERAVVRWAARNASSVKYSVRCGESSTEDTLSPNGAFVLYANSPDMLEVQLIAKPRWEAENTPDRSVKLIRLVRVKPPPLSIKLNSHTLRGIPGTHARLAWTITGAQTSWIDAPARGQRRVRITPSGGMPIDIHVDAETITFIAESATGQTLIQQVTVEPDLYNQMR